MEFKIFYSWQTDTPDSCSKRFIREAIDAAVADIADTTITESPRVDSGMEGIAGTPEVASIMFQKIDESAIFIGDVTLVGTIPPVPPETVPKRTPNPNVSLEMGYAAAQLGWGRVICVMNENFGLRRDQPFDVRNRRFPIDYTLDPNARQDAARIKKDLARWIRRAIDGVLENEHRQVERTISRMDIDALIVCSVYGAAEYFRDLEQDDATRNALASVFDVPRFRGAIVRLLHLGMLRTDVQGANYAYHWTYLGREVVAKLRSSQRLQVMT